MKSFLLKYTLVVLVCGVAFFQFYRVYVQEGSRWKGGGFGMYSEMHPLERQVWISQGDSMIWLNPATSKQKRLSYEAQELCMAPNQKNLETFAAMAAKSFGASNLHVQVWEPGIKAGSNGLKRKLVGETIYVGK